MLKEVNSSDSAQAVSTVRAEEGTLPSDPSIILSLGKYQVVRRVGRGGMGVVYEAVDPILERAVAIKVLREGVSAQPESVRKFLKEARTAARLNNPHVVPVYDADQEKGICYLVMELMEGGSAHDRIKKWGPFGWVEATNVIADACKGLAAVHAAGLIHRDIKPSNIMRTREGLVKLADFGLALTTNTGESSIINGQVVGTPLYMSPEQCRGEKIDPRSDIYALGATFYTLLTGKAPYEADEAMKVMYGHCAMPVPDVHHEDPRVPKPCSELLQRMMAKLPVERPADTTALLNDLQAVLALATSPDFLALDWGQEQSQPGIVSTTISDVGSMSRPHRRSTRLWLVTLCLILTAIAFAVGRYGQRSAVMPPVAVLPVPGEEEKTPLPPISEEKKKEEKNVIDARGPVAALRFQPGENSALMWATGAGQVYLQDLTLRDNLPREFLSGVKVRQIDTDAWKSSFRWVFSTDDQVLFTRQVAQDEVDRTESIGPNRVIGHTAVHPRDKIVAIAYEDRLPNGKKPPRETGGISLRWLDNEKSLSIDVVCEGAPLFTSISFSPDGKSLIAGRYNGNVYRLEINRVQQALSEGKKTYTLAVAPMPINAGPVVSLIWVNDTQFLAASGTDVKLYDLKNGMKVLGFDSEKRPVTGLAVTMVRKRIACVFDSKITILDLDTFVPLASMTEHESDILSVAFDYAGEKLASGDKDGKIILRKVE